VARDATAMTMREGDHEVVLYGAAGCHLCEEAAHALETLRRSRRFRLREVDIHSDPELERRYLLEIPVIEVNGAIVTSAPVDINRVRFALIH
jgi:glutaredoxin